MPPRNCPILSFPQSVTIKKVTFSLVVTPDLLMLGGVKMR